MLCIDVLNMIDRSEDGRNVSFDDLRNRLKTVIVNYIGGSWEVAPYDRDVHRVCQKLDIDPADISILVPETESELQAS